MSEYLVIRKEDWAFIPPDPSNKDWKEHQEWSAKGNGPDPADQLYMLK